MNKNRAQQDTLFERPNDDSLQKPLAERCRPGRLEDVAGHEELIGATSALRKQLSSSYLPSLIIWGPPGVGKTTIARLLAAEIEARFTAISAVTSGVKDVKEIIGEAREQRDYYSRNTVLFIDEIHRFNKAQQDALLHAVENGTIILIGATTENPSFEVIAPLLSRCQVLKLSALKRADLERIIHRALAEDVLLKRYTFKIDGLDVLIALGGGDARRTLNILEITFHLAEKDGSEIHITEKLVRAAARQNPLYYDKKGDYHYDIISAFIKSVRGSDPDAAVYYLAGMLSAGEDPLFIARRLIILASEDIGNAEPYALSLANAGFEAVKNIGMPEARIILSQVTTYLASVPKSNAAYLAINKAMDEIRQHGTKTIPLHIRNAPTELMKELNYASGYKYPHDYEGHFVQQDYLPEELAGQSYYQPTDQGREAKLNQYLKQRRQTKSDRKGKKR